jgi:putative endonuclease
LVVFVEVKARSSNDYGHPLEFVDRKKQNNIKNCAEYYLMKNKIDDKYLRFDVVSMQNESTIDWIENAF